MTITESKILELGSNAPDFTLPDTEGKRVTLADFADKSALVVMFICNHCPYVKHVAAELTRVASDYQPRGVAFVGISSNDVADYPEDGPEEMVKEKAARGYPFPYLYDETQEVAKAYDAVCTPDFYVFDAHQKLVYRGQLDDSRPKLDIPVTGKDIREALDNILSNKPVSGFQRPSIGCSIKWKV